MIELCIKYLDTIQDDFVDMEKLKEVVDEETLKMASSGLKMATKGTKHV